MIQFLKLITVEGSDRLASHVQVTVQEVVIRQLITQHVRLVVDGTVYHLVDHLTDLWIDTPYKTAFVTTDISLIDRGEGEREFYTLVVQCTGIDHILCDTVDLRDLLGQESILGMFVEVRNSTTYLIIKEGEVESYV